jgi:reactive intermediate/imine deaminase
MNTRRSFITHVGAAAIVGSTLADQAKATDTAGPPKKEVVPGSPYPTFSRAVRCGHMIYVSGVLGQIPGGRELASPDFAGQARQAMENLKASVDAAGSTMDRVVKCSAFLTAQSDFATFNEIYVTYFPSEPPARSTVIVKALVAPGAKIEIDCVAVA